MREELLRLDRVSVMRDGIPILNSFNMRIFKGEILGLLPINAQGLEEMIELIHHNNHIHYGNVWFSEILVNDYRKPRQTENPVFVLEGKNSLIDTMTVAENVFVVRKGMKKYFINKRVIFQQFRMLSAELQLDIPPDKCVDELSFFEKKVVGLIKAVVSGVRLVIARDLSNSASPQDLRRILEILNYYAESRGMSTLYICNHYEEIFTFCSRCLLMENGKIIKNLYQDQMTTEIISRFPQGFFRNFSENQNDVNSEAVPETKPVFLVRNLVEGSIQNLSFSLNAGECLVLLDLDHSLYHSFSSLIKSGKNPRQGLVEISGFPLARAERRLAFLDEKPIQNSLFQDMSYLDNLCFTSDDKVPLFWTKRKIKRNIRKEFLPVLGPVIDEHSLYSLTLTECYELIYNKIALQKPDVLICMQPFAEVDMYQRLKIIKLMNMLRMKGISLIILAFSLSDSLRIADRLILFRKGLGIRHIDKSDFHLMNSDSFSKDSPPN